MKNLRGKMVKFVAGGIAVRGILKEETDTRIIVQTDTMPELVILKQSLSMFGDAQEVVPLNVHRCFNNEIGCKGVCAFFKKGTENANDLMTKGCPAKSVKCVLDAPKNLYDVDATILNGILDRKMFGDFPTTAGENK